MRVLVTGATGFIGGHLVRRLLAEGHGVRALVRAGTDPGPLEQEGAEVVRGDLADPVALTRAATDCAHVYHVAALVSAQLRSRRDLEATNVVGPANVAAAAGRAGALRLVHVSSCGVYGSRNRFPADETTPLRPDTPYRVSKARGERAVTEGGERAGLPVVIARISAVIGPGGKQWARLCRSIRDGDFRLIGDGRNRLHLGDVTDIVDGLVRCAETPGVEGRCYNLAGATPVTMGELAATIAEELGAGPSKRPWPALPFRATRQIDKALTRFLGLRLRRLHSYDLFLGDRWFDISRARRELGYDPRVSVAESVRAIVRDYRRVGLL